MPDGPPHGRDEGAGRPLRRRSAAGGQEDPGARLQHLHGRGPCAALLLPRRPGLRRRPSRSEGRSQHPRRHRQSGARDRQGGDRRPQAAPRADGADGGQGHPPGLRAARRRVADAHRWEIEAEAQGRGRARCRVRHVRPRPVPRRRPVEPRRTSSWSPPRPTPTAPTTWGSWTPRTRSRSTTARSGSSTPAAGSSWRSTRGTTSGTSPSTSSPGPT